MKNIFKGLIILVLLALIGVLLYATRMNKTAKPTQPVTVNTVQQLDQVVQQIDSYYVNPNEKSFLREEPIADEELTQLKEAIDTVNASTADKNKVLVEIEIVEWKKAALDAVNHLYSGSATPVIKGDQVATKKVLADNLKLADVEKVATDFIDTMPKRLLLDDEEVPEDKFNTAITELINEAKDQFENFDKAIEALNKVKSIDIEDGQIGNIAKGLRDFEKLRDKVTDDNLLNQLNEKADQYLSVFLTAFTEIASEIPGYYDIALVAVEPSQLLTKLMKENRETLEATETETETTEEVVTEEIVTEESYDVPVPSVTESVPPISTYPEETQPSVPDTTEETVSPAPETTLEVTDPETSVSSDQTE